MSLRLLVVVGPTALGKTWLGVQIAHRLGSEIISADSRQVYRGLDLGTGKDLHEYAAVRPPVPYHMIDIVDPETVYTVYRFQQDCYRLLREKAGESRYGSGRVPLLMVGGSGLYVEAVLRRYEIANVAEDPELRQELASCSHRALVERLQLEAPELAATTDLDNPTRVIRALEISARSQRAPLGYSEPPGVEFTASVLGVRAPMDQVYRRISERVDQRLEQGMVDEVRRLLAGGLPRQRLKSLGMEYREIGAFLAGEASFEQMVERLKREIRRLAKRQMTYLRGMERRGTPIRWIDPGDVEAALAGDT
jgi:tRNA dimethylallyltransferase